MSAAQAFITAQTEMLRRYGVEADSRFIEVDTVHGVAQVLIAGDGAPIVMLNGIGTPAAMWAPLMARLTEFRTYAVDLPGFGLTDAPPGFTEEMRGNAVRFLEEMLDALGIGRAELVSNSMGSLWVSWLALDRPDRVAAMVHVGCPATVLGTSAPLPMRLLSSPALGAVLTRLRPPSTRQVEALGKMVGEHPLPPELIALLVQTELLPGFEPMFLGALHTLLRWRGARPDVMLGADQLASIKQPVQLFWGENDPFGSPAIAERVAEALPDSELHVIPGGHVPWLTRAESIAANAVPFLRKHIPD